MVPERIPIRSQKAGSERLIVDFSFAVTFIADEAARRRLDSMHQRLRLLEQQMETLEAEVGKASSSTDTTYA
jgi:hypothetical protein